MSLKAKEIIKLLLAEDLLEDHTVCLYQDGLTAEDRNIIRSDSILASRIFGITFNHEIKHKYYFWDNTTVSMKSALLHCIKPGMRVLEIGTGPSATLSRFVANNTSNVEIVAVDINENFLHTAKSYPNSTNCVISYLQSNLMDNVTGLFDVVFMNPPYATSVDLLKIGAKENSTEFSSGYGGITGGEITKMVVNSLNLVLQRNGIAILGINTKYLPDKAITDIILNSSDVKIISRHYSDWQVPPFSQVYLLNRL